MTRRIKLPFSVKKPILACGADMKGAFAFAKGREAFLVYGFGDLSDLDNFTKYGQAVGRYQKSLGIKPQIVACDLHPGYFSTRFAEGFQPSALNHQLCRVQHHEAHVASAVVDNNIKGSVIGVAFDGTGYGSDGNIWGGEFFVGNLKKFTRAAHLEYISMPGGEIAIKEPWRMAMSYLCSAFGRNFPALAKRWSVRDLDVLRAMISKNINSPLTSSAGRLFDAVGSLVLAKDAVSKEAELPIALERLVSGKKCGNYKFKFRAGEKEIIVDTKEIIKGIANDLSNKIGKAEISCKFHNTMAELITKTVLKLSKKFKVKQAALSGGVFQNRYLTARTAEILMANDIRVYTHSIISANDSGIPFGQIAIANARG